VRTLLDAPCGDFHWMKLLDLGNVQYIGGDIVPKLVEENQQAYGSPSRRFTRLDLMRDLLPKADLLLCRDCLIHLSNHDLRMALRNITHARVTYLLTTTYPRLAANTDIVTGDFRAVNLCLPPWNFPEPLDRITEDLFPANRDNPNFIRELALWRVADLRRHC